jgi:hypothetical protein
MCRVPDFRRRRAGTVLDPRLERPVFEAVKRAVRAAVASNWGKKPLCLVHIVTI